MMYSNTKNHQVHSMSEPKEKEKKLATNRLLDILRSQGTTMTDEEKVATDETSQTISEEQDKEEKTGNQEPQAETIKEESEPLSDSLSNLTEENDLTEEKVTQIEEEGKIAHKATKESLDETDRSEPDEVPDEAAPDSSPKVKELSSQDLLKALNKVRSKPPPSEEKRDKEIDESTEAPKIEPKKGDAGKKEHEKLDETKKTDRTGPASLLEQIQTPKPKPKPKDHEQIPPVEFDSTLLSTLSVKQEKRTVQDYAQSLFHLFNESSRRITIQAGENYVRLLQIKTGFTKTEIELVKEFALPYSTDNGQIEKSADLVQHIINNELDSKKIKYSYGAFYSPKIETKTHMLLAPSLNKKELKDLVDWNAKKNIPFSPDQAIIDYEVSQKAVDGEKHNIVIGISDETNIETPISYFTQSKLKPRLISTLPVLMWKLFLRNYPDYKNGCYCLIHLGEHNTTLSLVKNRQLLLSREILFGAEDFYKAVMQKVVGEDRTFKIDYQMAKQLLVDYGIPENTDGVTLESHISLYKLSIFVRPALERLTSEINRSMKYFTKQVSDIEWTEMLFDGICATFPNLLKTLETNLNVKIGLLNPMRKGPYHVSDSGVLRNRQLPLFTTNFALASEEVERINVLPQKIKTNYKYLFLYKVAAVLVAFLLPIYVVSTIISTFQINHLEENLKKRGNQWEKLSVQAKEYLGLMTDIDILNGYSTFLENDRKHSYNILKTLKMFSSVIPKDIKITKLHFKKIAKDSDQDNENIGNKKFIDGLTLSGFVQADASVSDIHLTNFMMKLEQLNIFTKIDLKMDETTKNTEGKLFFTLNVRY